MILRLVSGAVWGLAAFGVTISGLALAVLVTGLLEGWHPMPDHLSQLVALALAAAATWTAGLLCARAPGRAAALAVAVTPALIAGLGLLLMERTEGHGKGLAPQVVAEVVAVSAALVGGAAYLVRRTDGR